MWRGMRREGDEEGRWGQGLEEEQNGRQNSTASASPPASKHTYPQRSPYFWQSCALMSLRYVCIRIMYAYTHSHTVHNTEKHCARSKTFTA